MRLSGSSLGSAFSRREGARSLVVPLRKGGTGERPFATPSPALPLRKGEGVRPGSETETGGRRQGFLMVEVIVCVVMMAILVSVSIPIFQRALEQARADIAAANLRAVWSAQRLYWLENHTYCSDLTDLQGLGLIDPSLASASSAYVYQVQGASATGFTATATRSSSYWSGVLTIDQAGDFSGVVVAPGQPTIVPGFQ